LKQPLFIGPSIFSNSHKIDFTEKAALQYCCNTGKKSGCINWW